MHFIIPLLLVGLTTFPLWSDAHQKMSSSAKTKQTLLVDKELIKKPIKSANKDSNKKCYKAIDTKTKKEYIVCK